MIEYLVIEKWPAYRVGDDGSIWSRWRKGPGADLCGEWKLMHPAIDRDGYRRVDLHGADRKTVTRKVCSLVCVAFHGPRPEGMECLHADGNESNDSADNLAWGTSLDNHADKRRHGTIAASVRHGKTKLSDEQVREVLALKGSVTQQVAADRYGVSRPYIGKLWRGSRKRVTVQ